MAFAIDIDDEHALIGVNYRDCVSIEQRAQAMDRSLQVLAETGYRRILIDFSEARLALDPLATTSAFATRVATNAFLRQCRIAFVGPRSSQFNAAVENMADARGYGFERFFSRAEALHWLQH